MLNNKCKIILSLALLSLSVLLPAPGKMGSVGAFGSSPPQKPILMGSLGDSLTAATLADFPIPQQEVAENLPVSIEDLKSRFLLENKETYSWASGLWISSHYSKLQHYLRQHGETRPLDIDNFAHPGDRTIHIEGQARRLVEDFKNGDYESIKYITLLVGSNDVCYSGTPGGVPTSEMRENLMRAFRVLSRIKQEEPIRVLVVGIPRIPDLGDRAIRETHTIFGLTCQDVRNTVLGECKPLLNWNTPEEYDRNMAIVENGNRLLRNVVDEVNGTWPNIKAVYSDRLYNLNIPRNLLSIDCFHPSSVGQEALADQTWLDQPWFN